MRSSTDSQCRHSYLYRGGDPFPKSIYLKSSEQLVIIMSWFLLYILLTWGYVSCHSQLATCNRDLKPLTSTTSLFTFCTGLFPCILGHCFLRYAAKWPSFSLLPGTRLLFSLGYNTQYRECTRARSQWDCSIEYGRIVIWLAPSACTFPTVTRLFYAWTWKCSTSLVR